MAQPRRSSLVAVLADTERLCSMVPVLLHGGAPTVVAHEMAAMQSHRRGRLPAVRRCWDTMIGPLVGSLRRERSGVEVNHVHRSQHEVQSFVRAVEQPARQRGGGPLPCLGTTANHRVVAMIGDAAFGRQFHPTGVLIGDAYVSAPDKNQPRSIASLE